MRLPDDLRVYLVIGEADCVDRPIDWVVAEAVAGGVTAVQLREKERSSAEIAALGSRLRRKLDPAGVPLVINDDLEAAIACGAAALHLGQDDLPADDARKGLPAACRLGLSITSLADLESPQTGYADHLGIGPVYASPTKPDASPALGPEGLARIRALLPEVPAVAIGGITLRNARAVMETGVDGLAVVSAIAGAESPRQAATELRAIVEAVLTKRERPK